MSVPKFEVKLDESIQQVVDGRVVPGMRFDGEVMLCHPELFKRLLGAVQHLIPNGGDNATTASSEDQQG
jgi:hypothetical protein